MAFNFTGKDFTSTYIYYLIFEISSKSSLRRALNIGGGGRGSGGAYGRGNRKKNNRVRGLP